MGPFLEACWTKQLTNDNSTGIHFIILMLLWGCRKSEHAQCVWGELLPESANEKPGQEVPTPTRRNTSHVWLQDDPTYGPYVFFHNTKNGRNHRLPIAPMALELLKRRQQDAAEESARRGFGGKSRQFVFPAKNKTSKTGHYSDSKDLLDRVRDAIGLARLNRHDLRRTFGAMQGELHVPETIMRSFFNHSSPNVTATYTKAEWQLLRDWMARIEQGILSKAPNVYNSLKPLDWPCLSPIEPHKWAPHKPRTGRPAKADKEAKLADQSSPE
jgi:integrase